MNERETLAVFDSLETDFGELPARAAMRVVIAMGDDLPQNIGELMAVVAEEVSNAIDKYQEEFC